MLAIGFQFPSGRVHANPWGSHPNDGQVEWPPSPWRLLRALLAVGLQRCIPSARFMGVSSAALWAAPGPIASVTGEDSGWTRQLGELLLALGHRPPRIVLPPSTPGHARVFHPTRHGWAKSDYVMKPMLVHDAFRAVEPTDILAYVWEDLEFDAPSIRMLDAILTQMPYFGRADSACEARTLISPPSPRPGGGEAHPGASGDTSEPTSILVAAPETLGAARKFLTRSRAVPPRHAEALRCEMLGEPPPPDHEVLLRCLLRSADDDRTDGLLQPPGSAAATFGMSRVASRAFAMAPARSAYHTLEWALDTANPTASVLPLVIRALPIARAARHEVLQAWGRLTNGAQSERLSGHSSEDGAPLRGHPHAYWLLLDRDGDGRLDALVVTLRSSTFDERELASLASLRSIPQYGHGEEVLAALVRRDGGHSRRLASMFVSHTAYLPAPFHATHGRSSGGQPRTVTQRLRRDLIRNGLVDVAENVEIEPITPPAPFAWSDFQSQGERRDGSHGTPSGFRVRFAQPRPAAPFAVGVFAHFGMGVFLPE